MGKHLSPATYLGIMPTVTVKRAAMISKWRPSRFCAPMPPVVAAICLLHACGNSARAKFTFLNQIGGGPVSSPGYISTPLMVGNGGPDGQVVVDGGFAVNNGVIKAYAADGTYLKPCAIRSGSRSIRRSVLTALRLVKLVANGGSI